MRTSRGTLARACSDLQRELEERINEGFWARVKRYFLTDPELRKRTALARSAKRLLDFMDDDGGVR